MVGGRSLSLVLIPVLSIQRTSDASGTLANGTCVRCDSCRPSQKRFMKLDGFRSCTCWAERRIRKPLHEKHQRIQRRTVLRCTGTLACALCHAANAYQHVRWDESVVIVGPLLLHGMPCTSYVLSAPFFAERILGLRLRFMSVRSDEGDTTAEVIGRIIHEPTHIG